MKLNLKCFGYGLVLAAFLFGVAACDKKENKNAKPDEEEELVDSVALNLEPDDSTRLENSEIALPTFIGIEESFSAAQEATVTRHLKTMGLKPLALVNDSSEQKNLRYAAWGRGVELRKNDDGKVVEAPLTLHFKTTGSGENALGVYVDKSGKSASQLFFTDKRLVPVYVRELKSMGYEMQPTKSHDQLRYYEPVDGKGDFDQHFCIYISDEGCAVIVQYVDDDNDSEE